MSAWLGTDCIPCARASDDSISETANRLRTSRRVWRGAGADTEFLAHCRKGSEQLRRARLKARLAGGPLSWLVQSSLGIGILQTPCGSGKTRLGRATFRWVMKARGSGFSSF